MSVLGLYEEHCSALLLHWINDKARSNMFVFTPKSAATSLSEAYGLDFSVSECKSALEILNDLGCVITYYSPLTDGQYRVNRDHAIRRFGIGTWVKVGDDKLDPLEGAAEAFPVIFAYLKGQGHWAKNVIAEIGEGRLAHATLASDQSTAGAPAADRVVPLNHNAPEYLAVKSELQNSKRAILSINIDVAQQIVRDNVIAALDAAVALWNSAELTAIQLKVGILLAAENAAEFAKETAQAVKVALLVEAIKAFIVSKLGSGSI